ncbi:hypothetical protein Tco_0740980, partial [Tanacetum coccineum]
EINIEVNGALFTVKNKSNLRLQLTVLTKLSCRWITHNYVLHSMPADFELGVADVGVALAAAYRRCLRETNTQQPLFTIARWRLGAKYSNTPAGNTVEDMKGLHSRISNLLHYLFFFNNLLVAALYVKNAVNFAPNADRKIQYSIYILRALLPFLKRLSEEHIKQIR